MTIRSSVTSVAVSLGVAFVQGVIWYGAIIFLLPTAIGASPTSLTKLGGAEVAVNLLARTIVLIGCFGLVTNLAAPTQRERSGLLVRHFLQSSLLYGAAVLESYWFLGSANMAQSTGWGFLNSFARIGLYSAVVGIITNLVVLKLMQVRESRPA